MVSAAKPARLLDAPVVVVSHANRPATVSTPAHALAAHHAIITASAMPTKTATAAQMTVSGALHLALNAETAFVRLVMEKTACLALQTAMVCRAANPLIAFAAGMAVGRALCRAVIQHAALVGGPAPTFPVRRVLIVVAMAPAKEENRRSTARSIVVYRQSVVTVI